MIQVKSESQNSTKLSPESLLGKSGQISLPGTNCTVKAEVPLTKLTSYRVGGPAEWLVIPQHLEELQASLEWAQSQKLPVTFLGAGSNLLVSDRGVPGLVISTRKLRQTNFDAEMGQVTASAGQLMAILATKAADKGWQGLEWAVGIPGTVGGAVVMNAGAHNLATSDILVKTKVMSLDGHIKHLMVPDLDFSYRTSNLQGDSRLVVEATFQLQPGAEPQEVKALTEAALNLRHQSQPYDLPSCGSVFRNPHPQYAARLIEQSGLKGHTIGGAQVAQKHANFIVNYNHQASASDIFELICYIQQQVHQRWEVNLEPEVRLLGNFPTN
ncbi:UDP-N-acetylenolpyruvoylglucosamine reductase [Merismopedia glauca CCAP 1448/3]|uniref:UDP-N-acetylenolpyruvoylglucosamine reductase n=2 Tax=Merismopedia TaxID=53402 RepID=A0A2T1C0F1_9CYAN|nr:UDP-N-acetylenolpyruvoylglucosamine reductase [Merismopedia glauca CCAP 1448/3]